MTAAEFNVALERLELRQVDLQRLLKHLGGQTIAPTTIWRWSQGKRPVPGPIVACLALLEQLPASKRRTLLAAAQASTRPGVEP